MPADREKSLFTREPTYAKGSRAVVDVVNRYWSRVHRCDLPISRAGGLEPFILLTVYSVTLLRKAIVELQ
jgi:hypothetical protein